MKLVDSQVKDERGHIRTNIQKLKVLTVPDNEAQTLCAFDSNEANRS